MALKVLIQLSGVSQEKFQRAQRKALLLALAAVGMNLVLCSGVQTEYAATWAVFQCQKLAYWASKHRQDLFAHNL